MGLYARLDSGDLPTFVELNGGYGVSIATEIDYSPAFEAAVSTFMDVATDLVPVDTGFLQSTIHASTDGSTSAEFYADAEYAEYVEYGTWKMDAQPYFEPAVYDALDAFQEEVQRIQDAARGDLYGQADDVGEGDIEMDEGGLLENLLDFVLMLIIMILIALIDELFNDDSEAGIEIMIT